MIRFRSRYLRIYGHGKRLTFLGFECFTIFTGVKEINKKFQIQLNKIPDSKMRSNYSGTPLNKQGFMIF